MTSVIIPTPGVYPGIEDIIRVRPSLKPDGSIGGDIVQLSSSNTPTYHHYLKDHLGNNRVATDQNGTIEKVNHYYPFGGLLGESTNVTNQP